MLLLLLLQAKAQQELLQLSIREAGEEAGAGGGAAAREELPLLTEIFVQVAAQWKTMKSRREEQGRRSGSRVTGCPKTNG